PHPASLDPSTERAVHKGGADRRSRDDGMRGGRGGANGDVERQKANVRRSIALEALCEPDLRGRYQEREACIQTAVAKKATHGPRTARPASTSRVRYRSAKGPGDA